MTLSSGDCSRSGGGGRQPTDQERGVFDLWDKHRLNGTDFPGGNQEALTKSIRNKLFVLDDSVVVYPGHGNPTTIGFEKKANPFVSP